MSQAPAAATGRLGAWVSGHKPLAAGGAVASVGGIAYYRRKKAAAAASSATGGTATTAATTGAATSSAPAGFDSSALDGYNALTNQIGTLETQIQGLQSTATAPTPVAKTPTPAPVQRPVPSPVPVAHAAAAPAPASYHAITETAALNDLRAGQELYQSGAEAIGWDTTEGTPTGQSISGINPGGYYGLSAAAAEGLAKSGKPIYAK